jgi:hypothetical protein
MSFIGILEASNRNPVVAEISTFLHYAMEQNTGPVIDSGDAYNGTIEGSVNRGIPGFTGNCFEFVNGQITIPHNENLTANLNGNNRNMEFEFYVNFNTVSDTWFINKRGSTGATAEYQVSYYNGDLRFQIWNTDGSQVIWSKAMNFTAGQWYKIHGITDVSNHTMTIDVDDVVQTATTSGTFKTINTTTYSLIIGRSSWNPSFGPLNGKMDECKIWITPL